VILPGERFLIFYSEHTRQASSVESNTMGGATVLVAELRHLALVLLGRRLDIKNIYNEFGFKVW